MSQTVWGKMHTEYLNRSTIGQKKAGWGKVGAHVLWVMSAGIVWAVVVSHWVVEPQVHKINNNKTEWVIVGAGFTNGWGNQYCTIG